MSGSVRKHAAIAIVAMVAFSVVASLPASGAARYLTKKKALGLFYTKAQADAKYYAMGSKVASSADLECTGCVGAGELGFDPATQSELDAAVAGDVDLPDLLAYCGVIEGPGSYALCNGVSTPVDTSGDVGQYTSIAIGAEGLPVISYFDVTNADLKVAKCNDLACTGSGEVITAVDTAAFVSPDTSIAIGADGLPVISYAGNASLKVAKCNDPACTGQNETITPLVVGLSNVGNYSSIAVGTDGNPVISYYDAIFGYLRVAKCNDPACAGQDETINAVDTSGNVGQYTSIAVGADGNPVISYLAISGADLKVAKCNDAACAGQDETITAVDSTGASVGHWSSIAIGTDGNPVIGYHDSPSQDLKVVKCNDPACAGQNETITAVANTGHHNSIAIGSDGFPVISFQDNSTGDLMLAKCNDPACTGQNETITPVDTAGVVGLDTSIGIGPDGLPVISYYDDTNDDLKVARPPAAAVT